MTTMTTPTPYMCRAPQCEVIGQTSAEIRFHWIRSHATGPDDGTRKGLMYWLDQWYQTQPEERVHRCELEGCDRQGTVMTAAGLAVHYVFKHTSSPRAVEAMRYAESKGLVSLMEAQGGRFQRQTGPTAPAPF